MFSPVTGHDSNSVQLWGVKFQLLRVACCKSHRVAVTNYSSSLLKCVAVLGVWALVSARLAGPSEPLPFFHVNSSWTRFNPVVKYGDIRVFQACT